MPSGETGGNAPGNGHGERHEPRPVIPPNDPPRILEFLSNSALYIPEGSTFLAKFKSDARPPRYSFHGDNPRCFARLELNSSFVHRAAVTGKSDINRRGYGSVSLTCTEISNHPIMEAIIVGALNLTMQSTDGRLLQANLVIGVRPKPNVSQRKRQHAVQPEIIFCAPDSVDRDALAQLIGEDKVVPFGSLLENYQNSLEVADIDCAYWGEGSEREGISRLTIEINVAHPRLKRLLRLVKQLKNALKQKKDSYAMLF